MTWWDLFLLVAGAIGMTISYVIGRMAGYERGANDAYRRLAYRAKSQVVR